MYSGRQSGFMRLGQSESGSCQLLVVSGMCDFAAPHFVLYLPLCALYGLWAVTHPMSRSPALATWTCLSRPAVASSSSTKRGLLWTCSATSPSFVIYTDVVILHPVLCLSPSNPRSANRARSLRHLQCQWGRSMSPSAVSSSHLSSLTSTHRHARAPSRAQGAHGCGRHQFIFIRSSSVSVQAFSVMA